MLTDVTCIKIALQGNAEKIVDKAVHLYSDVKAKSQKKVLDDMIRERSYSGGDCLQGAPI